MKVAIRVNASLEIGIGHVMRCLTLAEELRSKGAMVVFVCREHPIHLCDLIASKGFEIYTLSFDQGLGDESSPSAENENTYNQPAHAAWLGVDQYTDAGQTMDVLQKDKPWDWLIVDHYALDARWESAMRGVADNIMVIDDLADREHDCDLLLDQNYFQQPDKRYEGLLSEHCQTLFGPKYALLRPEFRQARKFCRMRGNGIFRVLVYFGGNDPNNLTGFTLEALYNPELRHLLVEAVVGPNNAHLQILKNQAKKRPGTRLHIQPDCFTELMLRADLCIGAGGTTTWERLCLNLPSIVITVAKNQEAFTEELDREGYVTWIGKKENIAPSDILKSLVSEIQKLENQGVFSGSPCPVDGFGALRVVEKLIPSRRRELSLRRANNEDMDLFYFWVNDTVVRENSFQQKPITWEEHVSWFANKLDSIRTEIWILQTYQGLPVGQVRFDIRDETADIDYSLDPLVRERGWAKKLLELGLSEFKQIYQNIACQGRVKPENLPSRRCFQHFGFTEKIEKGISVFHWP